MPTRSLSAIIITHNEEHNIRDCLKSLNFCDEIILVDYQSVDTTTDIAREFGCLVTITDDWPGFGVQKQRALDLASSDWVISIDADERLTSTLQEEILQAISDPQTDGYYIDRKSFFLGKQMRFGGWSPDYVLRLGRREKAAFTNARVHEELIVKGATRKLTTPMMHYSYNGIEEVLEKQFKYALAGALKGRSSKQFSLSRAIFHSIWTFVRLYLIRLGFLDGRYGFLAAVSKAQETFWKYAARSFIS